MRNSKELKKTEQRDSIIDVCRFLGIVFVVVGHSGCPDVLKSWIYLFHMSLFFALSGYCYSKRYDTSLHVFVVNKIKSIYLPYVIYTVILVLLHNAFVQFGIYGSSEAFLQLDSGNEYGIISVYSKTDIIRQIIRAILFAGNEEFGGATWFLRILFVVNIFFGVFRYIAKKVFKLNERKVFILSIIFGLLGLVIGCGFDYKNIHLPLELQTCFSAFFAFEIGIVFRAYIQRNGAWNHSLGATIGAACVLLGLTRAGSIGLGLNSVGTPWFYFTVSVLGFLFTYSLAMLICNHMSQKFIQYFTIIGKHSLSIVFLHFIAFKLVTLFQIVIEGKDVIHLGCFPVCESQRGWWILYSVIGVFVPVLLACVYDRLKKGVRGVWCGKR